MSARIASSAAWRPIKDKIHDLRWQFRQDPKSLVIKAEIVCASVGAMIGSVKCSLDSKDPKFEADALRGALLGVVLGALSPIWLPPVGAGWLARQTRDAWRKFPSVKLQ